MYIKFNFQFFQLRNGITMHLSILLFMIIAVQVSIAAPFFKNVNEIAGIEFNHQSGKSKEKYMIETMGSGTVLIDYNNDGLLDIYLVNSGDTSIGRNEVGNVLYRNNGDGTFTDATDETGLGDLGYGMGGTSADYDNDGDTDLYLANFGADSFYLNNGDGSFTEISQEVGIDNPDWAIAGAFLDYDLDGDLDLFIVNYLQYSVMNRQPDSEKSIIGYQHPRAFQGTKDKLYQNNGDGTFSEVGAHSDYTLTSNVRRFGVFARYYAARNLFMEVSMNSGTTQSEEWVEDVPVFDAASGGLVLSDMVLQERTQSSHVRLGMGYTLVWREHFAVEPFIHLDLIVDGERVHPGGGAMQAAETTDLSGSEFIAGVNFSLFF